MKPTTEKKIELFDEGGLKFYSLEGKEIVRADEETYLNLLGDIERRRVSFTQVNGRIEVSTIFLGMNMGRSDDDPLFFETMVFGGSLDSQAFRTSTYEEAEDMHHKIVEKVRSTNRA
jgi:hypothetical protein